jgi:hypothetical protein
MSFTRAIELSLPWHIPMNAGTARRRRWAGLPPLTRRSPPLAGSRHTRQASRDAIQCVIFLAAGYPIRAEVIEGDWGRYH